MKTLFFEFLLYVYVNFIVEDWDVYTKWGKRYYYLPWLIRSVLVWLISPIFLVPFFITRTETWKQLKQTMDDQLKVK